jgi:hypothetical protein
MAYLEALNPWQVGRLASRNDNIQRIEDNSGDVMWADWPSPLTQFHTDKKIKDYERGQLFSPLDFCYILSTPKVEFTLELVLISDRAESP